MKISEINISADGSSYCSKNDYELCMAQLIELVLR